MDHIHPCVCVSLSYYQHLLSLFSFLYFRLIIRLLSSIHVFFKVCLSSFFSHYYSLFYSASDRDSHI